MPESTAGKLAWLTYLTGFWSYLFLGALDAWPRLSLSTWLAYVSIQAGHAVFWPLFVSLEFFASRP
jgi:hypothetical protein